MGRLAAVALAAFLAGCGGDDPLAIQVTLEDGNETYATYDISCDPPGGSAPDPAAVCDAITGDRDLYFPEEGPECPIPVDALVVLVTGTEGGEELDLYLSPCSDAEDRAIAAWTELLGFEHP
jgi:hypothetical protein